MDSLGSTESLGWLGAACSSAAGCRSGRSSALIWRSSCWVSSACARLSWGMGMAASWKASGQLEEDAVGGSSSGGGEAGDGDPERLGLAACDWEGCAEGACAAGAADSAGDGPAPSSNACSVPAPRGLLPQALASLLPALDSADPGPGASGSFAERPARDAAAALAVLASGPISLSMRCSSSCTAPGAGGPTGALKELVDAREQACTSLSMRCMRRCTDDGVKG